MQKKAVISVILAGILWGVISIFINKLSAAGFDPLQISLIRLSVAALVFTGFNRRGASLHLAGLDNAYVGRASILVAVEPLVGAVLGMTVYHESHGIIKIAGVVLILAAIVAMNRRSDPGLQSETVDRSERCDGYGEKRRED